MSYCLLVKRIACLLLPVCVTPVRERVEQEGEEDQGEVPDQERGHQLSVHTLQLQVAAKQDVQTQHIAWRMKYSYRMMISVRSACL